MAVRIVTDSTNYIAGAELARLGIASVPLYVHDGEQMRAETQIDLDAFYRRLADTRDIPTSSQPLPEQMVSAFAQVTSQGDTALGVFLSSRMSGTVQAAELAATMVRESDPNAQVSVLDSESNCMQEGFAVLSAAETAAQGGSLDDCLAAALDTIARTRFLFAPHTLEYLARGGRISGAGALLGSLLQIVPILTVDEGETNVAAKVRTRRKAYAEIASRMRDETERFGLRRAVVHGIVDIGEAERFGAEFIDPIVGDHVEVVPVGPVIGLHVGPCVGVVYETRQPLR